MLSLEEKRFRSKEYQRRYRERNPDKLKESRKKYRDKPKAKLLKRILERNKAEIYIAYKRKWYERNKELICAKAKEYARKNPAWKAAHCAKRRAVKKQAIPAWIDWDLVEDMYEEARYQQMVVDHIIPLKGKNVCGLHWEGNLQLLTAADNSIKHNKHIS